jgi:hypothetical protein
MLYRQRTIYLSVRHEGMLLSGDTAFIFYLDAKWEWSASCRGYCSPQKKCPKRVLNRTLDGSQNLSGRFGKEVKFLPFRESNHEFSFAQPVTK